MQLSQNEDDEEDPDIRFNEIAWKKLAGDVFRKPQLGFMLAILLGNGFHLWIMTFVVLIASCLGISKPDHFGNIVTVMFILYIISSLFMGYYSSRFYKLF